MSKAVNYFMSLILLQIFLVRFRKLSIQYRVFPEKLKAETII